MAQLPITNIIDISVSEAQAGVGEYNTSNLGLFSDEIPANSFGTNGFKQYIDPTDVATDFGTSSKTYAMALGVFSQQPNILAGGGQLVIMLLDPAIQTLAFSGVAASGSFKLVFQGLTTATINWNDNAAAIQAKLQAIASGANMTVTGSIASQSLVIDMGGAYGASPPLFTFSSNTLMTAGSSSITITPTITTSGDALAAQITAMSSVVQFFGILVDATCAELTSVDLLAAAAVIQALNKIGFFVTYTEADILPGGMVDQLRSGGFTQSRGLYYGDNSSLGLNAIVMAASYAGRALSTNFSGSNTTSTMNLKDLAGVQPDPSMTQTIYNEAKAAGSDIYASIQGVPKVVSFGANKFYDQVYNLRWFVGALQVAGFNFLAEAATKIPQTEDGMDGLKGAYRNVCEQGVTNQYGAPGTWTSPTTFGNQADLIANVAQRGYYIFSQPISQQSQTDRAARKAPLVQIAFKEAGAIQQSSVIVNVNA